MARNGQRVPGKRSLASRLVGVPPKWSDDAWPKFVALCLDKVLAAHHTLKARVTSLQGWSENRLSAALVGLLQRLHDQEETAVWFPMREYALDAPLEDIISGAASPDAAKRIDIMIRCFGMRSRVGFAIEAKVLSDQNIKSRTPAALTQAYVEQGMDRFVSGRYGEGAPAGAMVGYILSGSHPTHASDIKAQISASSLPVIQQIKPASPRCCPSHYSSIHSRGRSRRRIELHHLLLHCY